MFENEVKLMGYVNEVTLHENEGKTPFAVLMLATKKVYLDKKSGDRKEQVAWHTLNAYGKLVDLVKKYVVKGSHLYLTGEIQYNQWEDKNGNKRTNTVINMERFRVLNLDKKSSDDDNINDADDQQ